MSEERTGKRFPLKLPVTLRNSLGDATTSNISSAGVYVWSDAKLKPGSKVEFDITLPGDVIGSEKEVRIHCQGRVLRTEESRRAKARKTLGAADKKKTAAGKKQNAGEKPRAAGDQKQGVACVIEHYKFVRKK